MNQCLHQCDALTFLEIECVHSCVQAFTVAFCLEPLLNLLSFLPDLVYFIVCRIEFLVKPYIVKQLEFNAPLLACVRVATLEQLLFNLEKALTDFNCISLCILQHNESA